MTKSGEERTRHTAHPSTLARVTLTTREVQEVYGLTATFLRRHPEIPRIKCGHRTVVFKVSDIEQFLAQRAVA
jgi:hypothetical protein